ncbi:MAG TPA: DUF885 domain-containing protein [Natronosporangium sp.]
MTITANQLADELTEVLFDANPIEASALGIRDREDRLPDYTEAGEAAFRSRLAEIRARADQAVPAGDQDRVTLAVIRARAESVLDQLAARTVEYTITDSFVAPAVELLMILPMVGLTEPAHADGYLARLAGLPTVYEALAERHRAGIAAGRLPVHRLTAATVAYLDRYLADPASDSLRRPRPTPASTVDLAEFDRERDRLLAEVVHPALARYREVLETEVLPHGRPDDRPGLCWLPDGERHYRALARAHTTTEHSPEQLHQIGLAQVAGLREEFAELGSRVIGTTDLQEIFDRLRSDPALRWRDGDELLNHARATIERAEQAAPAWFGRLPEQRCTVEPVPEAEAPGAAAAYYMSPALDGSRPGVYFANTYRATERGRAPYEATAFHEAVPGHHFQQSLTQQLTDLPLLRRVIPFNAYGEGWGLYAERLADEMGLYSDDLARLGMLTLDSLRACRLVVDTGLHANGWSRQQAVDYLLANTANPVTEVETEVDRYIAYPGQALSYMTGRLEIQRLRAEAQAALGDRFDIRGFHDTVLGYGELPLTVLGELVRGWVERRKVG